ncbi:MAG: YfhO family protein [bacterium]|nr:YfhO family protein [bacterium]
MNSKKMKTERAALLLSFFLPIGLMLVLFGIKGIYPFGDRTFLSGDLYHQYMPFFSELLHKVRGGESLNFSFYTGIGSNFLALFVYYLASPFHALAFLFPEAFLTEFIGYLTVVKTGLCGLTACVYLQKHFRTKDFGTVLFAMFYAFSGFMAAYNYNIMWVDCIWVFPLIMLGLERLVREGKCGLYCTALGFCIFTNFYISIMICIFLVLYFGCLLAARGVKRLRSVGMFALFSLLAGGMAAVLWVPEVCALLQTDFGDMAFPDKIESYFSVLDMLARHCVCVGTERGLDHWPNIYCGSAVLLLIPMYLMNREISVREKFFRMALAGFLLLSFSTNILDFIWHGFNYPDSLPGRQSFLYIFLVLVMCCEAYLRVRETDRQQILYGYLCAAGFILFCQKFVEHEDFETGVKLLTLFFVTLYAALLWLHRTRSGRHVVWAVAAVALTAAVAECGANTWATSLGTTGRTAYLGQQEDYRALYEMVREREEGFCRVEKFTRKTKNDATLTGYPSASVFSSTMNSQVMDLYQRLGMRHSKVYYCFDGATALTAAMLNVNYMFGESDGYECSLYRLLAQSGDIYLYECTAVLPFGYVVPTGYDLPEGYENQALALQNEIVQSLGIPGRLFVKEKAEETGDNVTFTAKEGGVYYAILTGSGTKKVEYIGGAVAETVFGDLKRGCVLYLGYLEKDDTVSLINGDSEDETPKIRADVYRMDEEVLARTLALLSEQHLENVTWESDRLSGEITVETAGRLVLSVPYEDGWTVRLNGERTEGELFGGCLMALDLEPGQYLLEMEYRPAGSAAGMAVSAVSVVCFAGILLLQRRRKGKKENGGEERMEGEA